LQPFSHPTSSPSAVPSSKPTLRPTRGTVVTAEVSQNIDGLDASDFDTPEKLTTNGIVIVLAIVETISSISSDWSVQEKDTDLLSVQSARRLTTKRKLQSSSISITYQVTAGASGLTTSQAVSTLESALKTAATSGTFGLSIQSAYNTVSVAGGSWTGTQYQGGTLIVSLPAVTVVSVNTHKPSFAPTVKSDRATSTSDNSIIIIASIVATLGLISVSLACYFYFCRKQKSTSETDTENTSIFIFRGSSSSRDDYEKNVDSSFFTHIDSHSVIGRSSESTTFSSKNWYTINHNDEEVLSSGSASTHKATLASTVSSMVAKKQLHPVASSSRMSVSLSENTSQVDELSCSTLSTSRTSPSASHFSPKVSLTEKRVKKLPQPEMIATHMILKDEAQVTSESLSGNTQELRSKGLQKDQVTLEKEAPSTSILSLIENSKVKKLSVDTPSPPLSQSLAVERSSTESVVVERLKVLKKSSLDRSPSPPTSNSIPTSQSLTLATERSSSASLVVERLKALQKTSLDRLPSPPVTSEFLPLATERSLVVVERVKARKKSPPSGSSMLTSSQSLSLATDRSPSPSSSAASVRPSTVVAIENVNDAAMKALNKLNLDLLPSPPQPPTSNSILTSPQQLLTTEESSSSESLSSVTLATERLKKFKKQMTDQSSSKP